MVKPNGKRNGKSSSGNGKGGNPTPLASNGCKRDAKGRVVAGSVLNPKGGRTSYATKVHAELQALLSAPDDTGKNLTMFIESLYAKAIGGDMQAAKLILERVCPAVTQIDAHVISESPGTVTQVFEAARIQLIESGRLAPMLDSDDVERS